jgi:hypothetical protein
MADLDEIKDSLKETINTRIKNPFYGALIISWLLWNWQIPYITFFVSNDVIKHKANYIIENYSGVCHNFIYPILSALIITTIWPYILNYILGFVYDQNRRREQLRNNYDMELTLTIGEYSKIREFHIIESTIITLKLFNNLRVDVLNHNISFEGTKNSGYLFEIIYYHLNIIHNEKIAEIDKNKKLSEIVIIYLINFGYINAEGDFYKRSKKEVKIDTPINKNYDIINLYFKHRYRSPYSSLLNLDSNKFGKIIVLDENDK